MGRRIIAIALAAILLAPAGCSPSNEPVAVNRAALGTFVTIEAWGPDRGDVRDAIEAAFDEIADVEAELDAYREDSAVAAINSDPFGWHQLPASAVEILDATDRLEVQASFSSALKGVVALYDFDGPGHVPTDGELSAALIAAGLPQREDGRFRFPGLSSSTAMPGLDFGGAAKGLALDRARTKLRDSGAVTAALVTAGSTTVTVGSKPDGEPWRVGVEDPRQPDTVRLIAEWTGDAALSTSGDYQRYFERDGVRYHHILDPKTGRPAEDTRSLTVVGRFSGLDSDILSTALFVDGPEAAIEYARANGLGAFIVDSEGRTHLAPAPADSAVELTEQVGE